MNGAQKWELEQSPEGANLKNLDIFTISETHQMIWHKIYNRCLFTHSITP